MKKGFGRLIFIIGAIVSGYILFTLAGDKIILYDKFYEGTGNRSGIVQNTGSRTSNNTDEASSPAWDNNADTSDILVIVNKEHLLARDYKPDDLVKVDVSFTTNVTEEEKTMRKAAAHALEELFAGAKESGIELCAVSGYRSFKCQKGIYNSKLKTRGKEYTEAYVAVPGQSEHQTGLAMDVGSFIPLNKSNNYDFGQTKEGKWLKENAHNYGFILRYPQDKEKITGYSYEPWHIRYVGLKAAREIKASSLTLEEYLQ